MTGPDDLERAYRRWLRWYPRDFRAEYGSELLGVLMARTSGRVSGPERRDLMVNGVWMRLRPTVPRSARTVLTAVGLMCAGALLDGAALFVALLTIGGVRSDAMRGVPGLTAARWQLVMGVEILPHLVAAALAVAFWLWMAWAVGRGRDWARRAFGGYACLFTIGAILLLLSGGALYAPLDMVFVGVLWLFELAVFLLLFTPRSDAFFANGRGRQACPPGAVPADARP